MYIFPDAICAPPRHMKTMLPRLDVLFEGSVNDHAEASYCIDKSHVGICKVMTF